MSPSVLTYGSVCSGIEAASVAWHPLGMRPLWFSEIERFPSAVLAQRWPEVPNHGDFTRLISEAPPAGVDVLVGGTPCQAFSVAGLRGGLSDPRGNLALAFVALVDALRPRWVVWENVPGVLSSGGGRDFGSFLGGLAELGYGWAYRVLDAQYFGLAQRRQRVFVVASPGDWRGPAQVLLEPEGVRRDSPPRRQAGAGVAGALGTGASGGGGWRVGADEAPAGQAVPTGVVGPFAFALRGREGGAMPEVEGDCVGALRAANGGSSRSYIVPAGRGDVAAAEVAGTLCNNGKAAGSATQQDAETGMLIAYGGNNPGPLDVATACNAKGGAGRGVPVGGFYATAGSRPAGWRDESAPTLRCGGECPDREMGATTQQGVRRLMPVEMERLQGFPDHYTLLPDQQRKPVEDDYAAWYAERFPEMTRERIERLSKDGPRAKALGNSMAVPVMRWIGERVLIVDAMRRG